LRCHIHIHRYFFLRYACPQNYGYVQNGSLISPASQLFIYQTSAMPAHAVPTK
jgi:hypothetical protein